MREMRGGKKGNQATHETLTRRRMDPRGVQVLEVFLFLHQRFVNLILLIHERRERVVHLAETIK
jgi:hypothetical protein